MTANLVKMLQKADEAHQQDILVDANSMALATSYQNTNFMILAIVSILIVLTFFYLV